MHGGGGGVPDASRTAASTTLAFFLPHTRTTHTVALVRIRDSAMATASATRARDRGSVAGGAGTPAPLRVSGARGAPASRVAGGGRAGRGARRYGPRYGRARAAHGRGGKWHAGMHARVERGPERTGAYF